MIRSVAGATPTLRALLFGALGFFLAACGSRGGSGAGAAPGVPGPTRGGVEAAATPIPLPDSARYAPLLARLKGGDTLVDYRTLRLAYAGTAAYSPYGTDRMLRDSTFAALSRGAHAQARRLADSALALNYLDIFAQFAAGAASVELGDSLAARLHLATVRGLLASVAAGGGRSPDSAMLVISTDEEYALLQARGLQRTRQALGECAGRPCDVLDVVDPRTQERSTLYFDVSLPLASLERRLKE